MAVVFTVLASLFVSLTIIPFLCSLLLRKEEHPEGNWFLRTLKRAVDLSYRRLLHVALARPWVTVAVAVVLSAVTFYWTTVRDETVSETVVTGVKASEVRAKTTASPAAEPEPEAQVTLDDARHTGSVLRRAVSARTTGATSVP